MTTPYQHVLVAGGAGFVGASLALAIRKRFPGTRVTALDNLHRRGSELNLPRLAREGIEFVRGDVRRMEDLSVLPAPGLILECSAEPSVLAGYDGSPDYLVHTNLTGCFHCLEIARGARADFIFVSTSRVYPYQRLNQLAWVEEETRYALRAEQKEPGASAAGIGEGFPLDGPRSLYGMTKLAAELMVEEYADAYGLRFIINRCGLLSGPWQMAKSDQGVVALWVAAHYFRRPLEYIGFGGSGKQVRDVLHIDDLADLVLDQMEHFSQYAGQRYNVGGGVRFSVSLREATQFCQEITGHEVSVTPARRERRSDLRLYISDHRRVSAVRGWQPRRDVRVTLASIHDWLRLDGDRIEPLIFGSGLAANP